MQFYVVRHTENDSKQPLLVYVLTLLYFYQRGFFLLTKKFAVKQCIVLCQQQPHIHCVHHASWLHQEGVLLDQHHLGLCKCTWRWSPTMKSPKEAFLRASPLPWSNVWLHIHMSSCPLPFGLLGFTVISAEFNLLWSHQDTEFLTQGDLQGYGLLYFSSFICYPNSLNASLCKHVKILSTL